MRTTMIIPPDLVYRNACYQLEMVDFQVPHGIYCHIAGIDIVRVDAINGDVWPDWAGAGSVAAIAGYPNLTVPMGDVHGIPIGLSFMGAKDTEAALLAYGYAFEQASGVRLTPRYLTDAEDRPELAAAMNR